VVINQFVPGDADGAPGESKSRKAEAISSAPKLRTKLFIQSSGKTGNRRAIK